MFRDILLDIPKRWLGFPQALDRAASAPGRTRLPAWLLGSRWSPVSAHSRRKKLTEAASFLIWESVSPEVNHSISQMTQNIKYEKQRFYKNYCIRMAAGGRMLTYLSVENIPSATSPPYTPSQQHPRRFPFRFREDSAVSGLGRIMYYSPNCPGWVP